MDFDWAELAFGSKKALRELDAVFIAAPRELSVERFKQLVKTYLPQGNVVVGISNEPFVSGYEGQPQFQMLECATIQPVIDMVNRKSSQTIAVLRYNQSDLVHIIEKISFRRVVLVNGSWQRSFHTLPAYYALAAKQIPIDMVSPFANENEAQQYAAAVTPAVLKATPVPKASTVLDDQQLLAAAAVVARRSFDYGFQTGAVLARDGRYLAAAFNKVVPYQTYAMHHGAAREKHFSQTNDLNHYDTVHAEVELVLEALRLGIDLAGTTLYINLLPCPTCARMLADTPVKEVVYQIDHSSGYAIAMLEAAGKTVRRVILET